MLFIKRVKAFAMRLFIPTIRLQVNSIFLIVHHCGIIVEYYLNKKIPKKAAKVASFQNRAMVVTEANLDVNSLDCS